MNSFILICLWAISTSSHKIFYTDYQGYSYKIKLFFNLGNPAQEVLCPINQASEQTMILPKYYNNSLSSSSNVTGNSSFIWYNEKEVKYSILTDTWSLTGLNNSTSTEQIETVALEKWLFNLLELQEYQVTEYVGPHGCAFSFRSNADTRYSIVHNLYNNGLIRHLMYAIIPQMFTVRYEGSVYYGELPDSTNITNLVKMEIPVNTTESRWGSTIKMIYWNATKIEKFNSKYLHFNAGLPYIYFPKS